MLIFFITSSLSFPSQEKPPNAMPKSAWKSISCLFGMALPVTQVLDKGKASYCIDFIFQSCTALCPKHFIDFIFQSCTALCPKHFSTLIQVQIYFQFYSRKAKPISSVYIYIFLQIISLLENFKYHYKEFIRIYLVTTTKTIIKNIIKIFLP